MSDIRVRFAPSPTGFLHIGSLRTVLFNYFIAKSLGGKLILRIEDTDQRREVSGAADKLIEILDWIGLKFDEGPGLGGEFGPYVQSQRRTIYDEYVKKLLVTGQAYHCFCSSERLLKMKEEQIANKLPPRYDRVCRNLSKEEVAEKIVHGEKYVIRQKMPLEGEVVVHDELHGDIKFKAENLEDHVLVKTDGMPTYQFANVIDDRLMEISHVVRGDEWISSFPKNILLYQSFGWQPPKYLHIPLILNKEGGKLSKRQGDVAVEDYRAKGYLPEALVNFCALLGWHPKGENEILSIEEIIKEFKVEDIGISPAIFDIEKLDYMNGVYIRKKSVEELTGLVMPFLVESKLLDISNHKFINNITGEEMSAHELRQIVSLAQERMRKLSEVGELSEFFFLVSPRYEKDLLIWKKFTEEQIKSNLLEVSSLLERIPEEDWTRGSIEDALMSHIQARGVTVGEMLWPMRAGLTGRKASPGPFEVAEVLGKEKSLKRLKMAIEKLQ